MAVIGHDDEDGGMGGGIAMGKAQWYEISIVIVVGAIDTSPL